ncbi:MAG TPA: flagellar basal body protein [Caulobacteraceae bacterium]|jgi:hypothetical protein|nr:flagellar basal body protein [Caulobacteraceae bacterium]
MIAAADTDDRVAQLTGLTERLTKLLAAEAAAFEARRPQDTAPSAEETIRLANLYRHESVRIKADPSLVAGTSPAAHKRLMQATQTFEAVLARHGRALAAAKTVTEGLVQAIAEEVAATRSARSPYGANARAPAADASAITLNRRA